MINKKDEPVQSGLCTQKKNKSKLTPANLTVLPLKKTMLNRNDLILLMPSPLPANVQIHKYRNLRIRFVCFCGWPCWRRRAERLKPESHTESVGIWK